MAIEVRDSTLGIGCRYRVSAHFYAASVIKVTILAALLRKAQEEHRDLSDWERDEARQMITWSDDDAATALWDDTGMPAIQHFLHLAGMSETQLDPAWGLTRITAHDETLLLRLLSEDNHVLTATSRRYELYLMHHVVPAQRWGAPAAVPAQFTWHVKNGWAPLPDLDSSPWTVNTIGVFTRDGHSYTIVVLSDGQPSVTAGIDAVSLIAAAVNHALGLDSQDARHFPRYAPVVPGEAPMRPAGSGPSPPPAS